MMLNTYQHLPEKLNPVAFHLGLIEVSWYSLAYLAAFAAVYFLVRYRIRRGETNISLEAVQIFFPWAILGLLVGARLGDVFIYDWDYFSARPLEIFLPFDPANNWQYVGIHGMSFFGGLVGLALAFAIFSFLRFDLKNPLESSDLFAPAIPLALAFGRLGNFVNGELYGRVTNVPWGMYFPLDITGQLRHPSQLYEMLLEGILLFIVLWSLRKYSFPVGYLTALFLIGYGLTRFTAEFFRHPDNDWFFLSLTIGQWFSVGIILLGFSLITKNRAAQPAS